MKSLTANDIKIEVIAEYDDSSIRGNCSCSGDDELDKNTEDELIERINEGDVWAWALVSVKGTYKGLEATDYLGQCSYKDEQDFVENSGYYEDMVASVLQTLQDQLANFQEDFN